MQSCHINWNHPGFQVHSSSIPAYLPDPLSDFSDGLVLRLCLFYCDTQCLHLEHLSVRLQLKVVADMEDMVELETLPCLRLLPYYYEQLYVRCVNCCTFCPIQSWLSEASCG